MRHRYGLQVILDHDLAIVQFANRVIKLIRKRTLK